MKKLFALMLFACMALFSGVILSSCGEDNADRTIVVIDDSALCDIRIKTIDSDAQRYLQGNNGQYIVSNHSNLRVEINAGDYGVDLTNLEIRLNGRKLEKDKDLFETSRTVHPYSPIPDENTSLYYGYFNIPYIESNAEIKLLNAKKVSSTFNFEVKNLETTQKMLEETQINISSTEEENFVSFYDFLTGQNPNLTRQFDLTEEPELNTYRTFRLKFNGVAPFQFSYNNGSPFTLVRGEEELNTTFTQYGNEYILDLGATAVGALPDYKVLVDFTLAEYKQFEIQLPQDNQTFSIKSSSPQVTMENIGECVFDLTKNMEEPVSGVTANYENLQVLANGTHLVFNAEENNFSFPEEIRTPYQTEIEQDTFIISVTGITYTKDSEEEIPQSLKLSFQQGSFSTSEFNPVFYGLNEMDGKTLISGVDEFGTPIGFQGQKYALTWQYHLYEDINAYRTSFDFFDIDFGFSSTELKNLKDLLPEDISSLEENVFTQQITFQGEEDLPQREIILKAVYNPDTEIFDQFELQFVCFSDSNEFVFNLNEYRKTIDISVGFDDENTKVRCAIFDPNNEMVSDGWTELKGEPFTYSVTALSYVAFEITLDQNDFTSWTKFAIENSSLGDLSAEMEEIETEPGKTGFIIKFIVSNLYCPANSPFTLVRNA